MVPFIFANNIKTTLAAALSASGTSATLASSAGLPTIPAGSYMPLTFNDAATGLVSEVVYVTAISGATLTIVRAQEGTSAQTWGIGDIAFVGPTAAPEQNVINEVTSVISGAGLTPSLTNNAQLLTAIQSLLTTQFVTYSNSTTGTGTISSAVTFTAPHNGSVIAVGVGNGYGGTGWTNTGLTSVTSQFAFADATSGNLSSTGILRGVVTSGTAVTVTFTIQNSNGACGLNVLFIPTA